MADVPAAYNGREQAYIKHLFLDEYLERLIHKTASRYDDIAYVDGFSGPWKSGDEVYGDTSFGIALRALTTARNTWATLPNRQRFVKMSAHLVETDLSAYDQLKLIDALFPSVNVKSYHSTFTKVAPQIARAIPDRAFSFVLVDPKGFSLDMEALRPLIAREPGEVVFNFMYDFANRFVLLPTLERTFDRLLPEIDWRNPINDLAADPSATPADRKRMFLGLFKDTVRRVGNYKYVLDVDILDPGKDRTLYFLVYGTRHSSGVEVFRDCQMKTLEKQSKVAGELKLESREASGQFEFLRSMNDMAENPHQAFVKSEKAAARRALLDLTAQEPSIIWEELWPRVLADHALRKVTLGQMVGELQKSGELIVEPWPDRKRTPENAYRIRRGA